jgi:HTH-type transcriptional regulator / antitoxin HipB
MNIANSCYTQPMTTKRSRTGNSLDLALRRVREARKAAGLTQEEMGDKLGMSRGGYGLLETGSRTITLEDLFNLSRILGRPVEYFLGLDTGLTEDEGQLLALYRGAADAAGRALILRLVRSMLTED